MRVLAVLAVLTVATACGSSSGHSNASGGAVPPNVGATVELRDIAFKPSTVTIKAGRSVLWKFDDGSIAHNVTGDGYRSSDMTSGTYSHAFTKAGTYDYQCTIHSGMDGEVIVTP